MFRKSLAGDSRRRISNRCRNSKSWNVQLRLETGTALQTLSCNCLDVVNKQKNRIVNGRLISSGNFWAEFKYLVKHTIHATINISLNTVHNHCIFVMLIRVFVLRWRCRVYLESILFKLISTVLVELKIQSLKDTSPTDLKRYGALQYWTLFCYCSEI